VNCTLYFCDQTTINTGIAFGSAALKCQIGCGNSSITDTPILKCTSFSAINDWAIGEDKIIASIPKTQVYAASFTGGAWLALQLST
jgi:hypothetical protein